MVKVYIEKSVMDESKFWKKIKAHKIDLEKEEYETTVCEDMSKIILLMDPKEANVVFVSDIDDFGKTTEKIKVIKGKISSSVVNLVGNKKRNLSKLQRMGLNEYIRKGGKKDILKVFRESLKLAKSFINEDYVHVDSDQIKLETKEVNIVTVAGASGGVGKTSVASNLAASYAEFGMKVCLVDFSLQYGDVGLFTKVRPEFSVYDLVTGNLNNNPNLNLFIKHVNPNFFVLPAPTLPEQADYITRAMSASLVKILGNAFDVIIFDTSNTLNDLNLELFKMSQQIVFVTTKDLSSIKNTKLALDIFEKLNILKKVGIVINKENAPIYKNINNNAVKKLLNQEILGTIPYSELVFNNAISKGVPFIYSYSDSKPADSIRGIMSKVRYNCIVGEYDEI